MGRLGVLFEEERRRGVLDASQVPSSITAHESGYIDRNRELIVGLQTDAPLKRAIFPNGGYRLFEGSLTAYGFGGVGLDGRPLVTKTSFRFLQTLRNLGRRLNGGRDEITGGQVGPALEPLQGDALDIAEVRARFDRMMDWLADVCVNAMNVIHYMHDKYAY